MFRLSSLIKPNRAMTVKFKIHRSNIIKPIFRIQSRFLHKNDDKDIIKYIRQKKDITKYSKSFALKNAYKRSLYYLKQENTILRKTFYAIGKIMEAIGQLLKVYIFVLICVHNPLIGLIIWFMTKDKKK